jgi:mRNA interferase RelE/StbE
MRLIGFSFGPDAAAFLDHMAPGKVRAQLTKKPRSLHTTPYPNGCKKLVNVMHGEDPVWRIRCGDYRILYVVRAMEVLVLRIGHRKDIYR